MEFLKQAAEWLDKVSMGQMVVSAAFVMEFVFRMMKTEKPKSIAYMIADGMKKCGELLTKAGTLLDKVLPQRLK